MAVERKPGLDVQTSPERLGLESVAVVIPALNEEAALPFVLRDLPPVGVVVVVDNGSTDGTGAAAERGGAVVVREGRRGYGAACLRGLAEIAERVRRGEPAPAIVAFIDADYSDHADLLSEIVAPILRGECQFVIGSRMMGRREAGSMPPQSVFGNWLASWLLRLCFSVRATDLGPFRAIDAAALARLQMSDRGFGWTIEMQIKAARVGLVVCEIPVPYRRRIGSSKISGTLVGSVRAGVAILYLLAKHWLLSARPRR